MGMAMDERGRALGDKYGQTKEEVFNDLNQRFPDAFQIVVGDEEKIRQLFDQTKEKEENASE